MALPEGTRLGPYEIAGLLGAGGMGEVYRARDPRLGRSVAIKILPAAFSTDSDRLWRFEREARAVASLNHPHISTVHDIGEHDGHRYLVMELLEGQPLNARLESGPLPMPELLEVAMQIADGLEAAHGAGVIHRDLKPANIFITKRGEAKLLDFGLAKLSDEGGASEDETTLQASMGASPTLSPVGHTTLGTLLGTAAYMSPEQARGDVADAQSDLFSYGAVLYEMATGRPAFTGKTMAVLFDAVLNKNPRPASEVNPQLPPELDVVIAKALEKDRDRRYRSAADLIADLKRIAPHAGARAAAPAPAQRDTPVNATAASARSRRTAVGAAVAVALLAAAGAAYFVLGRSNRAAATISLDNLLVKPLTSTGKAAAPAISPDGKYVVYLQADDEGPSVWLRQTDATNAVRILAAEPGARAQGATVGPDSTFVDVWRTNGVWRIPFLGGTPELIIDRANTPVSWSPDGRQMAFIKSNPATRGQELVVANSDGADERAVGQGASGARGFATNIPGATASAPAWSPDGRLIATFQRLSEDIRDIGVAVFDVSSGQVTVVKITGDVPQGVGWLDQSTLVVGQALQQGTPSQLWQVTFPDGKRTRLTNDVNRYSELSLSADANSLVTSRLDDRVSVWVGDAKGVGHDILDPAPYMSSATQYATVGWDGPRVLFTHTLNGRFEIFRLDPSPGGTPQAIVPGREMAADSDGTIVYRSLTGNDVGLWKVGRDGQRPVLLAKGTVSFPSITPDRQQAIYSSSISGVQTIWRVPLAGGEAKPMLDEPVSIAGFSDVSPDGKSIVVQQGREWIVCDFPACAMRRTLAPVQGGYLRWTPDGRGISFIAGSPESNLWVQPIDGSPSRQITHFNDGRNIGNYAWSSDGRLALSRVTYSADIVLFRGLKGKP